MLTIDELILREKICKCLENEILNIFGNAKYSLDFGPAIDKETLNKCQYFEKNPDYILSVSKIDSAKIKDVILLKNIKKGDLIDPFVYLRPAVCLKLYPLFTDKTIDENFIINTCGYAYRNENYIEDGIRLNEFRIREIVFFGTEEFVNGCLIEAKNKAFDLAIKVFGEEKTCIMDANDNFFPNDINKKLGQYQRANHTKQELVVKIGNHDVACASVNYHGDSFSKKFNFDSHGKIVTGCIGFGLERWITAYVRNNSNYFPIID